MKKSVYFFLLTGLWFSCQDERSSEIARPNNAAIVAPTTPGPSGFTYALQAGDRCFLLDNQQRFWQYEPTARSFSAKSTITLPNFAQGGLRAVDFFSFSLNGKAYLGGQSIFGIPGTNSFPTFLYAYDPVANAWASVAPCPGNGAVSDLGRVSFAVNGKGYVCFFVNGTKSDGTLDYNSYRVRCYEYDPIKNQWSLRLETPLPLPQTLMLGNAGNSSQAVTLTDKGYWLINAYPIAKRGQSLTSADAFALIFEYDPSTNQLTLKLTTNPFGSGTSTPSTFSVGLVANNKLWLVNEGAFDNGVPVANQLFVYDPGTNQLNRTSASVIIEPNKELSGLVGFAINAKLYIGMGEYGHVDGTPGGEVSGFAEFDL